MSGYRSYRAPREDQSRLFVPELDQVQACIDENRKRFADTTMRWMDVPVSTVREWAREETIDQAQAYTYRYLPASLRVSIPNRETRSKTPLIISGHQPELFHPGVWFKNFLLSSLSEKHSGIGVNILVDHDLARTFALSVPFLAKDGQLYKETLSVDTDRPNWPWEHAKATDLSLWRGFSADVIDRLRSVGIAKPLLCELWPNVIGALEQGWNLGEALSAARHIVERSNGLQTLELPFSRLASERSFACFVGELLTRIDAVHEAYNAARHDYRLHNKIKNRLQPLPALARDGDWFEAPFWVYSAADPVRRALWVFQDGNRFRLSDRQQWQIELPSIRYFEEWFREWCELKAVKVSIRPRALTTTTFLRLAVADLFIHGIGGGKYDQMTDQIVRLLWGGPEPHFLVATATLHLPVTASEEKNVKSFGVSEGAVLQRIRDWRFSPERLCVGDTSSQELATLTDAKRKLLLRNPTRHEKPAWHGEIQRLNESIREQLPDSEVGLREVLQESQNRARESTIRTSREYSFALFPSEWIVDRLKQLCKS